MDLIRGDRIGNLILEAATDRDLKIRLFHCPEKVLANLDWSPEEKRAILTGDLSRVDLGEELLDAGRRLFTEFPAENDVPPAAAAYLVFSTDLARKLCT